MEPETSIKNRSGLWALPGMVKVILFLGIVVHFVLFILLATRSSTLVEKLAVKSFVSYGAGQVDAASTLMNEQSRLFDTEPLLLHTRWNYRTPIDLDAMMPRQGAFFAPYAQQTSLSEALSNRFSLSSGNTVDTESLLADLLTPEALGSLRGFVNAHDEQPVLEPIAFQVRLRAMEQGRVLREASVASSVLGQASHRLWSPVRVQVFVHPDGSLSIPWLTHGSGNAQVDAGLLDVVSKLMRQWSLPEG